METIYNNHTPYEIAFPTLLESNPIQIHSYIREQITLLYFNITRMKNDVEMQVLSNEFCKVLYFIKNDVEILREYLIIICKLICQTRSTYNNGKGEHALSYMLLYDLYQYFPDAALVIVKQFVYPNISSDFYPEISINKRPYGAWRDIKYLCEYIRTHSSVGEADVFIKICVELLNSQLKADLESWKFSIHAFSREHISYVSKWIPREHKKFSWLYEKLVLHWANKYSPNILRTVNSEDSYIRAICKCKRQYRKVISLLNKGLNTVEIKQCSQKLDEIQPNRVSAITCMKQRQSFIDGLDINDSIQETSPHRQICSQNFRAYFNEKYNRKQSSSDEMGNNTKELYQNREHRNTFPSVFSIPISYFVKEAMRLLTLTSVDYEIEILNQQWSQLSQLVKHNINDNMIPIMNVSQTMQDNNSECYHTAIGYALLISQHSLYKNRILAYDYQPTWINMESVDNNLVSMVDYFQQAILYTNNTIPNIEGAFDLFVQSLHETNCNCDIISNMTLVILSDSWESMVSKDSTSHNFVDIERPILYQRIVNKFSLFGVCPIFAFWNLSTMFISELPIMYNQPRCALLSGQASSLLYSFYLLQHLNMTTDPTPYDIIISILQDY
jgi:hypothetical protein